MAKQSFISHTVNGYSRYDVPESKAFTCTPGILYPVRIDFINARDRVTIAQGIDVRSNPLAVPSFNPYTVRLHRFWVPMQLYHPEMRTNSSKFDFNNLSLNWIPACSTLGSSSNQSYVVFGTASAFSNSLLHWLRVAPGRVFRSGTQSTSLSGVALPVDSSIDESFWSVADTYLAYWDIVRNYYSYSQWGLYSYAWPASWRIKGSSLPSSSSPSGAFEGALTFNTSASYFTQVFGNLEFLDAYFESQFYPSSVPTSNGTYNRGNLWSQIIYSDITVSGSPASDGYPVSARYPSTSNLGTLSPSSQFALSSESPAANLMSYFVAAHPMAVVPSNPDRFSRLLPNGTSDAVSMSGVTTIPQLAIASRLQEYKDLLGAGGNRYSDWLETFFASKIEHVDRPKLLFSASQTVNVQVVMNQSGQNNFALDPGSGDKGNPLGQQGGTIAFNTQLGRSQSYYFREPGYMIDMLSIRPVYYWNGVKPDYLNYQGSDYFNPIYNDIGYQDVPYFRLTSKGPSVVGSVIAREPCFNEFRSSYDEVLGQLSIPSTAEGSTQPSFPLIPLYSYWVQQRTYSIFENTTFTPGYYPALFVDMSQANSSFASKVEDNFFVNMSYSVRKKNLVNKTFATRLSNR